jgi:hypothetical protein
VSADKSPVIGEAAFRTETLPSEAEQRRLHSLAETRGLEVFAAVELERVEGADGLLVFVPDGSLWVQGTRHHVDLLGRDKVRVTYEGDPLTARFLIRANEQVRNFPATLEEWQARQGRKTASRERSRQEAERERERLRASAEPVTYDDLAQDGARMTLRRAGEAVLQAGGIVRNKDGRLIVSLPPSALYTLGRPSLAARAATRLFLAESAVLAAPSKRNGEVNVPKLAAEMVTPAGRLVP